MCHDAGGNLGRLICIEGVDGSGKTSIARRLAKELCAVYVATPPTAFRRARKYIDRDADLITRFHFYLASVYAASADIERLIKTGDVICDRYIESTFAHHEARGLIIPEKRYIYDRIKIPDFTVVLHASEDCLIKRIRRRRYRDSTPLILELDRSYQHLVGQNFLRLNALHVDTTNLRCIEAVQLIKSQIAASAPRKGIRHASSG